MSFDETSTYNSIMGVASTSLSALTNAEDVEPLLSFSNSRFIDEFVLDDTDFLAEMIAEEDLVLDPLEELGGTDLIAIEEAFLLDWVEATDEERPDIEYNRYNFMDIPCGQRNLRPKPCVSPIRGDLTLLAQFGKSDVVISNGNEETIVGKKDHNIEFSIHIECYDYFKMANTYNEEVGGKGVGLGFSNFFHSTAILILAKNTDGVIEPHEGYDYGFEDVTFEITGMNYFTRVTKANVIINKYLLVGSTCDNLPYQDLYTTWSWKEDVGLVDAFMGTAFDYETTNRSKIVYELAKVLPLITDSQRRALGLNFVALKSEQKIVSKEHTTRCRDFSKTRDKIFKAIRAGSKLVDGVYFVPSPFRVLYPQLEPEELTLDEVEYRRGLDVRASDWGRSTYHTWNSDDDPSDVCRSVCDNYPERTNYPRETIHQLIQQNYKKYKAYTSAVIQAAVLPKIHGKAGCFYDIYNRMGISWFRPQAGSLSWNCVFYCFNSPGEEKEVGRWYYDDIKGVYISPTFKVSRQDISYAAVLPAKISSALASCRPLLKPDEYNDVEAKIMMTMCIQMNSTWATSHRAGANRYLTCCHMSNSGDLPSLMEAQLGYMNFHRFCDYFVMRLMVKYIDNTPSTNRTPLFQLPLAIMSYEKDFSQTLQWHMRDAKHSTNCMIKVTEAAKRHSLEESETNLWLSRQLAFFKKMLSEGISISEYKQIMRDSPEHPTLNLVMFVGMCDIVKPDIKTIGSVQHSMGLAVWNMLTDRHCAEFTGSTASGIPQIRTSKVVEAMSSYLSTFDSVSGIYELIAKMSVGKKLPPNYLLCHYKDSRESDRDITQQIPQHRIKQCFPETLIETFTGNNEADQMSDGLKYNKHVNDTMDPDLRGRGMHASEDRSKFCQEQEPQLQGLGVCVIGSTVGSTAMHSAAAMTLMNKRRVIIYPYDADTATLLDGMPTGSAVLTSRSKIHMTKTVTIEKNMTNGLGAVTAGAIHTIYVTAQAKIMEMLVDGLKVTTVRTTSDDVKRSAYYEGPKNRKSAAANFFYAPNRELNQCMMVNNDKKFMPSEVMCEFNNVVATHTGMIPQSPVFSTLCVQPLLSKSLFGDIVTVVNASRSTMSWGCPPDTMQASMCGMLSVLRQKWLLNSEDMSSLYSAGLLPSNISEHISGFWIRNENVLKRVFSAFDEDQRKMILSGDVPLYDMLKRAELDLGRKKKKKLQTMSPIKGLNRANKVVTGIMRQRLSAERLMTRHVQPIPPRLRIAAKAKFMQLINGEVPDVDVSELNKLEPPKVTISVRGTRRIDRAPTSIGASAVVDAVSLQRIRGRRSLGINYQDILTAEEERIANLPEDEYDKAVAVLEKMKHYEGFSYKSPSGLPLTRIFDNTICTRPASFNFSVELPDLAKTEQPFTYLGYKVDDFKPIIYGSASIHSIRKNNRVRLAFGCGKMRGSWFVFYKGKKRGDTVRAVNISGNDKKLSCTVHEGYDVYYRLTIDASPLLTMHHCSVAAPYSPGLIGDNEAIMNYGFYNRSNQPSGFAVYRCLFREFSSEMPMHICKHMPQYPFFPYRDKIAPITRGNHTALVGYHCINKLRLINSENPDKVVHINLEGDIPAVFNPTLQVEDIEW